MVPVPTKQPHLGLRSGVAPVYTARQGLHVLGRCGGRCRRARRHAVGVGKQAGCSLIEYLLVQLLAKARPDVLGQTSIYSRERLGIFHRVGKLNLNT